MSKIVNISEATSIASHSLALIAGSSDMLNAKEIASITDFSRNHLAKVLQVLVKNNYLDSTRGPKGGFYLKKSADDITLLEIHELIEGAVEINHCRKTDENCPFAECVFGDIRERISIELRDYLKNRKISNILKLKVNNYD